MSGAESVRVHLDMKKFANPAGFGWSGTIQVNESAAISDPQNPSSAQRGQSSPWIRLLPLPKSTMGAFQAPFHADHCRIVPYFVHEVRVVDDRNIQLDHIDCENDNTVNQSSRGQIS